MLKVLGRFLVVVALVVMTGTTVQAASFVTLEKNILRGSVYYYGPHVLEGPLTIQADRAWTELFLVDRHGRRYPMDLRQPATTSVTVEQVSDAMEKFTPGGNDTAVCQAHQRVDYEALMEARKVFRQTKSDSLAAIAARSVYLAYPDVVGSVTILRGGNLMRAWKGWAPGIVMLGLHETQVYSPEKNLRQSAHELGQALNSGYSIILVWGGMQHIMSPAAMTEFTAQVESIRSGVQFVKTDMDPIVVELFRSPKPVSQLLQAGRAWKER